LLANTKIEKGLGNTNHKVCSTVKNEREFFTGEKFACGKEREADARRVQPIGGYSGYMDAAWLAGHMQEGRILLCQGDFSALH
jgi:hypothetical protein